MKRIKTLAVGLLIGLSLSSAMAADNVAVIIANKDYQTLRDVREAFGAFAVRRSLRDAGFEVLTLRDMDREDLADQARSIQQALNGAERVIVFLAGHMGSNARDSWLMTTDARRPGGLAAGLNGLSVNALMDLLADKAGSAAVLVGRHGTSQLLGSGLEYGYVPGEIPQGVTVFSGPTGDLVNVIQDGLLEAGHTTRQVADAAPNSVSTFGFVSRTVAFLPAEPAAEEPAVAATATDFQVWTQARTSGTQAAFEAYLTQFPNGRFASQAKNLLTEMQKTPMDLARETEESLALSRDSRAEIQRNLSILGFDTRGVDGILGRGSRAAITNWQKADGFVQTGYVTGPQIATLQAAAAVRSAELEEEARLRMEAEERQDAAFWRENVRGNGEEGMRAYLKRYPDGIYSDIARERLIAFDEERRKTAARAEGGDWDVAAETNTIAGYQAFLAKHPNGVFAESATEKLAELQAAASSNDAAAKDKAQEQQVLANPLTRILVERRLAQLGFKPGKVDGKIDANTRKAIRRFQRAAGYPVTGFASQQIVVRLLAAQ